MRIAIDGRALTGRYTGDRTYWQGLLKAMPAVDPNLQLIVYSRTAIAEDELPSSPQVTKRVVPAPGDRLWSALAFPGAVAGDKPDLIHVQYTTPPQRLCPCPVITTVHDITFNLFPEWYRPRDRVILNSTIPIAIRKAARVITVSESSREDILRAYRPPGWKVCATLLGLPERFVAAAEQGGIWKQLPGDGTEARQIEGPYMMALGVQQPRKNYPLLAEAFARAKREHGLPHRLAFVGKVGWKSSVDQLIGAAERGGGGRDDLVFPGYVPDDQLAPLFAACDAFAAPALYEGFGLTPLEAMACGVPTVVSDAPAMPEVVGDAALVLPARDMAAWVDGIARILTDGSLRARLAHEGPTRAVRFRWEATARATVNCYRDAIALPAGPT